MTPDRSALLPNRRILGPRDGEGLGRLLGDGACGGEHDAAVLRFGFRATAACASRCSTARSRRTAVCSRTCRASCRQLSGTSRRAWHEPGTRARSYRISAHRPHAISQFTTAALRQQFRPRGRALVWTAIRSSDAYSPGQYGDQICSQRCLNSWQTAESGGSGPFTPRKAI